MIDVSKELLIEAMPEFLLIQDEELRDKCIRVWQAACRESLYDSLEEMRVVSMYDPKENPHDSLIHHVRLATRFALACAKEYEALQEEPVNYDYLLAGALLHDVDKPVGKGKNGPDGIYKYLTHGVYGVCLAYKEGLPLEVLHIINAHTNKLNLDPQTPEALILHWCDYLAGSCGHMAHGNKLGGKPLL